jgi:hypothetical protein
MMTLSRVFMAAVLLQKGQRGTAKAALSSVGGYQSSV